MASAHRVYIPYCSSDGWMGDTSFDGRQYRGQRIVAAVLRDLRSQYKLGAPGEAQTVVFGGGSAGGRGAMTLLDKVTRERQLGFPDRVVGFLDSPYYIDTPVSPAQTPTRPPEAVALAGTVALLPPTRTTTARRLCTRALAARVGQGLGADRPFAVVIARGAAIGVQPRVHRVPGADAARNGKLERVWCG